MAENAATQNIEQPRAPRKAKRSEAQNAEQDAAQGAAANAAQSAAPNARKNKSPNAPNRALQPSAIAEEPKRKKHTLRLVVLLVVLLLLIAVAVFIFLVIQFDIFELRTWFDERAIEYAESVNPDPEFQSVKDYEKTVIAREKAVEEREETLLANEAALVAETESESERLRVLREQLDKRENDLNAREVEINAQRGTPIYRRPASSMTEQETNDMENLALLYSAMESAEAAAKIISEMNSPEDMAAVIYFMTPEAAARIMAQMEPAVAADITNRLLRY